MRKMMALLLTLILMGSLAVPCSAAVNSSFLHSYYVIEDGRLQCYAAGLPEKGELTVTAGSQVIPDASRASVKDRDLPITVYCLVDTSTAMSYNQVQRQQEMLLAISDGLRQGDGMVIATLGETLEESECYTSREDREAAIAAIERKGGYTDLFKAVTAGIDTLTTNSKFAANRCMVILSDGIDDGRTSVTEEKVVEAISKSTIPVYSAAILDPYPGWYALEHAKHLDRFADASVGGDYFDLSDTGLSATAVGMAVLDSMLEHSVIELDVQQIPVDSGKDELMLMIRYESGENKWEDTMRVYTADIAAAQPAVTEPTEAETEPAEPETEPAETETVPSEEEENAEEEESRLWIILAAAAAVLLAAGAVVVVCVRKKRSRQSVLSEEPMQTIPAEESAGDSEEPFTLNKPFAAVSETVATPTEQTCQITLYALGYPEIVHTVTIPRGRDVILGRDRQADIVLDAGDTKLSRKHCCLSWDGNILCVKDLGSKNGTICNGVALKQDVWMIVENDTRLRMGKFEYRVVLEMNN